MVLCFSAKSCRLIGCGYEGSKGEESGGMVGQLEWGCRVGEMGVNL